MSKRSITKRNLLVGWALLAALGAGCERRAEAPPMAALEAGDEPDQESWDVRFGMSEDGRPRAHIVAPYMARYEREDSSYALLLPRADGLEGESLGADSVRVVAYLFDEEGDSSATIEANRMTYLDDEGRFEARGDVVVVTREGKRLESEHLVWFEAEREVRTPGFVKITTPTERIQGYELVSDEDLDEYTLARVTGQVTVEEE